MVPVTALWLPILLSAVIVFVASSILHMVLPIHKSDYRKLPEEERVRDALHRKDDNAAASASKAVDAVLRAQTYANGNVSPQVITAKLIRDLATTLK